MYLPDNVFNLFTLCLPLGGMSVFSKISTGNVYFLYNQKAEAKEKEKIQFKSSSFMKPGLVSPCSVTTPSVTRLLISALSLSSLHAGPESDLFACAVSIGAERPVPSTLGTGWIPTPVHQRRSPALHWEACLQLCSSPATRTSIPDIL